MTVVLDAENSEKLQLLAERAHVEPESLARALLATAIEEAGPSPRSVRALLDGIEGAFEAVAIGLNEVKNGEVISLEDL